ncbi:MAG: hypothetical protein MJZ10_14045 [Fibrobacter sp.]|nr:hypothetical protein [Fibrobacter sp.]
MMKVKSTEIIEKFRFSDPDKNEVRTAFNNFSFCARCAIDGEDGCLWFFVYSGCRYNGASNKLGWPIKRFYGNDKKDCCGLGHDLFFAHGGYVEGLKRKITFNEANDYIRGAMREAGFKRYEAGIVDRAVRIPLVYLLHWGKRNDNDQMHLFSKIVWIPGGEK